MICGDCGVLTKDPVGTRCICISCARLIAGVRDRSPQRGRLGFFQWVAILVIVAFVSTMIAILR